MNRRPIKTKRRYMVISIGDSNGLKNILDVYSDESGVNYVEGQTIFLGTFYNEGNYDEIIAELYTMVGTLIFDITESEDFFVNLPTNYELGLFPELKGLADVLNMENLNSVDLDSFTEDVEDVEDVEEYYDVDDILDKLSRNNYDRDTLTENELKILDSNK